jgi:hypothetical protein
MHAMFHWAQKFHVCVDSMHLRKVLKLPIDLCNLLLHRQWTAVCIPAYELPTSRRDADSALMAATFHGADLGPVDDPCSDASVMAPCRFAHAAQVLFDHCLPQMEEHSVAFAPLLQWLTMMGSEASGDARVTSMFSWRGRGITYKPDALLEFCS